MEQPEQEVAVKREEPVLALGLAFILAFIIWVLVLVLILVLVVGLTKRVVGDVAGIPLPIVVRSARRWGGGDGGLTWGSPSASVLSLGMGNGWWWWWWEEEAVWQRLAQCFRIWLPQTLWEKHG